MAKYDRFSEIVSQYENLPVVVRLREMIRRLWHLEVVLADANGFVIDPTRGKKSPSRNQFCHKCLFDKEGLKKCDQTVLEVTEELEKGAGRPGGVFDHCHTGFKYMAYPIYVRGEFVGSVVAGGFLTENLSAEKKREILEKSAPYRGTEIADVEAAFSEIPVLTEVEVRSFFEIISFGVEEVTRYHEEIAQRESQIEQLAEALENRYAYHSIVGRAPAMRLLYTLLDKLKDSDSTALIQGENGTGKEMVAKAIHYNSPRRHRRFVSQNCSAFNDNLLDSELFGHVKGSFTGAIRDKKGLFEMADGGTFFMDEIGDMSHVLQVKLLRVLQEGVFIPVGGTEPKRVDVRIVAATNQDLRKMVDEGDFREDLFYRINVINIYVPPLRERREDIPILVEHFLRKYDRSDVGRRKRVAPETLDALMAYNWPGNVRQLENEIQRSIVLAGTSELISRELLSPAVLHAAAGTAQVRLSGKLRDAMEHLERQMLLEGLRRTRWNKSKLSRELGISRATLIGKVEKYGLVRDARP
ncbi:MAG TPA: sigma 54-interacting transcriptional regulator [Bdellovibrionota bacterium]|nr:sigma 54-interacting transcriptional regulator [Bdellovibrionota bacterium]